MPISLSFTLPPSFIVIFNLILLALHLLLFLLNLISSNNCLSHSIYHFCSSYCEYQKVLCCCILLVDQFQRAAFLSEFFRIMFLLYLHYFFINLTCVLLFCSSLKTEKFYAKVMFASRKVMKIFLGSIHCPLDLRKSSQRHYTGRMTNSPTHRYVSYLSCSPLTYLLR